MLTIIKFFVKINQRCSIFFAKYLPQTKPFIIDIYNKTVASYANAKRNQTIIDAGCGTKTTFVKFCKTSINNKIIGIDLSINAFENKDVDEVIITNLETDLPFSENSIDIISSSSVVEHLKDVETFVKNCSLILKPGGIFINLFSNRYAPFALLNYLLPEKISRKLLYFFRESMRTKRRYRVYYNKCTYNQFNQLLQKYNFEMVNTYFNYYQSFYFDFFFPLFIASAIYEIILSAVKNKNLCSHMIIIAKKIK